MKKIFLTLFLVVVFVGGMNAGPVDQQRAQQLGAKFLNKSQLRLAATVADRGVADGWKGACISVTSESANGVKVQKINLCK